MFPAEKAAVHCVPPEQRTAAGPGAVVLGGGLTKEARFENKTMRNPELQIFVVVLNQHFETEYTSKACWILSLFPPRPGRLELKDCVFSVICPPSKLSSGNRVSDHNLHTPSSQDVSKTLQTVPLKNK